MVFCSRAESWSYIHKRSCRRFLHQYQVPYVKFKEKKKRKSSAGTNLRLETHVQQTINLIKNQVLDAARGNAVDAAEVEPVDVDKGDAVDAVKGVVVDVAKGDGVDVAKRDVATLNQIDETTRGSNEKIVATLD